MKTKEEIEQLAFEYYPLDPETIKDLRAYARNAFVKGYTLAQQESEWIKVEDRLPGEESVESSIWVVGCDTNNDWHKCFYSYTDHLWFNEYKQDKLNITHWMIPHPPKTTNNDSK